MAPDSGVPVTGTLVFQALPEGMCHSHLTLCVFLGIRCFCELVGSLINGLGISAKGLPHFLGQGIQSQHMGIHNFAVPSDTLRNVQPVAGYAMHISL